MRFEHPFSRAKILATLGPATATRDKIAALIKAGADGVRLNYSHGSKEFFSALYTEIHEACIETSRALAVLADLQGPKIRIGELAEPQFEIAAGELLELTIDECIGTKSRVSTSYKPLPADAMIGDKILIDDGLIQLEVRKKTDRSVFAEVVIGGILKPKKGMNLPGMQLSTPALTERDIENIRFAMQHRVDYVALSFVRNPDDIKQLRSFLTSVNREIPIIAKIEKKEAVDNFEAILQEADGIMIARGDLGVEMEPQDVPVVQKEIIYRCNNAGKLVITATQMLESMIQNPLPTRAEASDVANAVWDGTSVVMLSGETSVGAYPVRTVAMMNSIVTQAESKKIVQRTFTYDKLTEFDSHLFDAVNKSMVDICEEIKVAAIVVFTKNGRTARSLSKYRPSAKIIAFSEKFETMNNLSLQWGVTSLHAKAIEFTPEHLDEIKAKITEAGFVESGDIVLFAAGSPYSEVSHLHSLRFERI